MTPEMKSALAALEAAKAARRLVQKKLDGELSMSILARKDAAAAHLKLDMARISAITPASAHVRAARIRDAEIDAEAQDHEVERAERYVERVTAELAEASRVAKGAAVNVRRLQTRQQFERYTKLRDEYQNVREGLLGAWMADPNALTNQQWLDVDDFRAWTASDMGIQMLIGVSMHDPRAFGGDPRPARGRISDAAQRYEADVQQLARDDEPNNTLAVA